MSRRVIAVHCILLAWNVYGWDWKCSPASARAADKLKFHGSNFEDFRNSRACRARGIRRTTRHMDKRAALYTAADLWPTNQVSAWPAERASRPTRATSS